MKTENDAGTSMLRLFFGVFSLGILVWIFFTSIHQVELQKLENEKLTSQVVQTFAKSGLNPTNEIDLGNGWYYLSQAAIESGAKFTSIKVGATNTVSLVIVPAAKLNEGECGGLDCGHIVAQASRQLGITNGEFHCLQVRKFY